MNFFTKKDLPFHPIISFEAVIQNLENQFSAGSCKPSLPGLLEKIRAVPELKTGFTDISFFEKHKPLIRELLAELFPEMLTTNEIKAVTVPLSEFIFNPTQRFKKMLEESAEGFKIEDIHFDNESFYVVCCNIILNIKYPGITQSASPLYYVTTDKKGIKKYYRLLYNTDFLEFIPTEKAKELTEDEISFLLENYDNEELWREKFPPGSWIVKGFALISLYDATVETALSNLKQVLFNRSEINFSSERARVELLKSIFNIPTGDFGFSAFDPKTGIITTDWFNNFVDSYLLTGQMGYKESLQCTESLMIQFFNRDKIFLISDIDKFLLRNPKDKVAVHLRARGIKSCALIPVTKEDVFLGIVELVSTEKYGFNSITTRKIETLKTIFTEVVENLKYEYTNRIEATIQREYTAIHPSVAWKFRQEAENSLKSLNTNYRFGDIIFRDVYALYGETDIRSSSVIRNICVQKDLTHQLTELIDVTRILNRDYGDVFSEEKLTRLDELLDKVQNRFESDTEQETQQYISYDIHSAISHLDLRSDVDLKIKEYFESLDYSGFYYKNRRKFDESVAITNKKLVKTILKRQKEIQIVFPHYFESFTTDGLEYNMYAGASINRQRKFEFSNLYELRLWQLQVTCEMMRKHYRLKEQLPIMLEVTSLISSFSILMSIRFRTLEKRFDIDGAYNSWYEVIKKRIDKAVVEGTGERITQVGKITFIYMFPEEEKEYLAYLEFLRKKGIITDKIEFLKIDKLQGISGLKALRFAPAHPEAKIQSDYFTYSDFLLDKGELTRVGLASDE